MYIPLKLNAILKVVTNVPNMMIINWKLNFSVSVHKTIAELQGRETNENLLVVSLR